MPVARRIILCVVAVLALPALTNAQSLVNTSRSNIKGIVLTLDGAKDTTDLVSVEGGQLVPDITLINTAPFQYYRQLGRTKYEDFKLTMTADIGPSLTGWISETLAGKARTRAGHMILMDDADRIVQRVAFSDALITEVSLPALDGSAKDTSYLTIVISPTKTASTGAFPAGTQFVATAGAKQKLWAAAAFRVRFDDGVVFDVAEGKKGLNAVNVKQARQIATSEGPRYQLDEPKKLSSPDLEFTSGDGWASSPYSEDAARMLQGIEIDHNVAVDYLNEKGDVLFTMRRRMAVYKTTIQALAGLDTGSPGGGAVRVSMVANGEPMTITFFNGAKK